jgi:hypothetical protein
MTLIGGCASGGDLGVAGDDGRSCVDSTSMFRGELCDGEVGMCRMLLLPLPISEDITCAFACCGGEFFCITVV